MLSEVPEGWAKCSLGEVVSLEYGKSLPEKTRKTGEYPVYGSAGIVGSHNEYLVESQSIVVGRKGTIGSVYKTSQPFFPIDTTYYVIAKNELNWDWLTALLESLQLVNLNEATGVPGLNRERAYASEIFIPPLVEQHCIAEILSSVDESIQATQAVIEQAERVKRGLMEELLTGGLGSKAIERGELPEGWTLSSLGEAGKLYAGGTPNRKIAGFYEPAEIAWVKSGELRQGFITETEEFISQLGLAKSSAKLVPANTPVLAMYGATAGEVGWLAIEAATNQAVLACEPKQGIDGKFLYYSLKNASQSLIARQQGGAQPNLSKSLVSSFEIALPTLSEQRHIANVLSDIDDFLLKQVVIAEQQNLTKRGLMDDLLTGKVRTV